jgi:hypothetical protein
MQILGFCGSRGSAAGLKSAASLRLAQGTFRLVTEQLAATEPGIRVPQGKTLDTDRTNTKRWVQMSRNRARNHSHNHSHRNREPLLALPRVAQGRDRDLSRVQLPSHHRDHHDANHHPHRATHRRSSYRHRHASRRGSNFRHHRHDHRGDGQRMKEQPTMPAMQPPPTELLDA